MLCEVNKNDIFLMFEEATVNETATFPEKKIKIRS